MATESTKKTTTSKAAKVKSPKAAAVNEEVKTSPKIGKSLGMASAKVRVTQMVGTIGRRADQEATLIGLGLNKRHKSRVLEDTPSVRGMIYKVRHLVKAESVS